MLQLISLICVFKLDVLSSEVTTNEA